MNAPIELFLADGFCAPETEQERLVLSNDADPRLVDLATVKVVELQFPKFVDGRAFTQAWLLRRRMGFTGHIRATGDVLVDQLQQMQRSGFTQAVLRADQSLEVAQRQLQRFDHFYQGDAVNLDPRFGLKPSAAEAQP
jgi:uncharacterized protein (DUF934 family)